MDTVFKEFDDLKARMRSENTTLAERIKAIPDELLIEIANKNLSDSLTKQLKMKTRVLRRNVLAN
jgi:hypothetical protein